MRTPSVKSVKLTEKNTRLGVRMKTQARCKSQESFSSTCPKNLRGGQTDLNPIKDMVLGIESKTSIRTLPTRLNSESRDLKDIGDIFSGRQPRLKDSQSPTKCDETFLVKFPIKEKVPSARSVRKVVPVPSRPQIANVNLVQQLKKKDLEIIKKQKLKTMERIYPVRSRTRTNDPNKVYEKEVKSRQSFEGIKASKHFEEIYNLNRNMEKLHIEISGLHQDISRKDSEIQILKQENLDIQETLSIKVREINYLQDKLNNDTDLSDNKLEIVVLRHKNLMLEETVSKQKEEILMLKKLSAGNTETAEEHFPSDLEKETADFLEKVSSVCKNKSLKVKALSKDKNVKINLKITVRKEKLEKVPHQLSFSETFESPAVFAHTPCQTFSVREDVEDEVFCDTPFELPNDKEVVSDKIEPSYNVLESIETCQEFVINESPPGNDVLDVNINSSDYPDVSIGTFNRADDLDQKMQQLWERLSSQNNTLDHLKNENRKFTTSVEMLEEELSESFNQHKRLVDQVNVVKQLFC